MREVSINNITTDNDNAVRAYVNDFEEFSRLAYLMDTGVAIVDIRGSNNAVLTDLNEADVSEEFRDAVGDSYDIIFALRLEDEDGSHMTTVAIDSAGDIVAVDNVCGLDIIIDGYATYEPGFDDEEPEGIDDIDNIMEFFAIV